MDLYLIKPDASRIQLKVYPNFRPEFEYKNVAVDFESIPIAFSVNQKIPVEGNAKALDQAHYIESRNNDPIFDIEGYVGGQLRVRGKMIIQSNTWLSEEDSYDVSIVATDFSTAIEGKTLKQLLEGIEVDLKNGEATLLDALNHSATNADVALVYPVYNNPEHFGEAVNAAFTGVLNPYSGGYLENAALPVGDSYENQYTYVPFIKVLYLLRQIFGQTGYKVETNLDATDMGKVIQYTGMSLDYFDDIELLILGGSGISNTYIPSAVIIESTMATDPVLPLTNPYIVESEGAIQIDLRLNVGASSTPTFDLALDVNGFPTSSQWNNLQPNTVHDLQFVIPWFNIGDEVGIRINPLFSSTIEVLPGTTLTFKNLTKSTRMNYYETISLARLVPAMGVAEYIMGVRKYFNLKFAMNPVTRIVKIEHCGEALNRKPNQLTGKFERRELTKNRRPSRIKLKLINEAPVFDANRYAGEVPTLGDLGIPVIGKVLAVQNTGAVYRYEYDEETNVFAWRELGKRNLSIEVGEGKEEVVDIPCELMTMISTGSPAGRALMPSLKEQGTSDAYNSSQEESNLRFLMFHGLQNSVLGVPYPMASPHNYDTNGNEIECMSLELGESESSIYMRLHKSWLPVIYANKTISRGYVGDVDVNSITDTPLWIDNQQYIVESVVKAEDALAETCLFKLRLL